MKSGARHRVTPLPLDAWNTTAAEPAAVVVCDPCSHRPCVRATARTTKEITVGVRPRTQAFVIVRFERMVTARSVRLLNVRASLGHTYSRLRVRLRLALPRAHSMCFGRGRTEAVGWRGWVRRSGGGPTRLSASRSQCETAPTRVPNGTSNALCTPSATEGYRAPARDHCESAVATSCAVLWCQTVHGTWRAPTHSETLRKPAKQDAPVHRWILHRDAIASKIVKRLPKCQKRKSDQFLRDSSRRGARIYRCPRNFRHCA